MNKGEKWQVKKPVLQLQYAKKLPPQVKGVYRVNGRIMEIRLRTGNQIKNMSILNTYAPRNGYPSEVIQEYWNNVDAYISLIPINHIKIWCTDNNGQLTRNSQNESNVGPWTIGKC